MKILTERELADELEISQWTIQTWRKKSGLPHFRIASRIFYRLEAVLEWISEEEKRNSAHNRSDTDKDDIRKLG